MTSAPAAESSPPPETKLKMLASGLGVVDLAAGSGPEAKAGDQLHVHYVAWLEDGTEVDSSRARGKPYTFELGAGTAIKAWDEGLVGMQAGGKRRLIVPSPLGYGAAGSPPSIPPDALLEFEVELLQIE